MKAISIKQPWASLIVEGLKPVENRSKPWKHRGPLAIHASKKFDENFKLPGLFITKHVVEIVERSRLLTGGFVGSVNMVDCVIEHFGYVFENPKKCDLIPWKGQQGVFNINYDSFLFREIWGHYPYYHDCLDCGELSNETTTDNCCVKCGSVYPPF